MTTHQDACHGCTASARWQHFASWPHQNPQPLDVLPPFMLDHPALSQPMSTLYPANFVHRPQCLFVDGERCSGAQWVVGCGEMAGSKEARRPYGLIAGAVEAKAQGTKSWSGGSGAGMQSGAEGHSQQTLKASSCEDPAMLMAGQSTGCWHPLRMQR